MSKRAIYRRRSLYALSALLLSPVCCLQGWSQVVDFKNPPKAPIRTGQDPNAEVIKGPGLPTAGISAVTGASLGNAGTVNGKDYAAPPAPSPGSEGPTPAAPVAAPVVVAPPPLPEEKHPAEMPAAMKLFNARKYAEAQKMFEKFINTGVADEATHMNLAYCLYYQRKYTAALKQFHWVSSNAKHDPRMRMKAETTSSALSTLMSGICPANCLKPNDPHWAVDPKFGSGKIYKFSMGNGAWKGFSEGHMGDLIQFQHGEPFDVGPCPTCGGKGYLVPLRDGDPLPNG
ncbi:MAG: hypothetical protein JST01_14760 [Cyanobacteria bacterium SZAS TMP-1]|nr:hypothetical protein [Cyanobacteria bacterium SZAS TMP-1]